MIRYHVLVCGGTGCTSANSAAIIERMEKELGERGLNQEIAVVQTGCFGLCGAGPIMIVYPDQVLYSMVEPDDIPEIIDEHLVKGRPVQRLVYDETLIANQEIKGLADTAFYKNQLRVALRNCGNIDPTDINDYLATGGYKAIEKVLSMSPEEVIEEIKVLLR